MVDPAALSYDQRMAEVGRVRMQNADLLEKSKALFAETERLRERLAATEAVAKRFRA